MVGRNTPAVGMRASLSEMPNIGDLEGRRAFRPTAPPSSVHATLTMRANRRANTVPELAIRSELHRRGLRYRVDLPVDVGVPGRRPRPDIVFTKRRVAVFVDGCFWHACPEHGELPIANRDFWRRKLDANCARDRRTDSRLGEAGWRVIRIWEHEVVAVAADRVEAAVRNAAVQSGPVDHPG